MSFDFIHVVAILGKYITGRKFVANPVAEQNDDTPAFNTPSTGVLGVCHEAMAYPFGASDDGQMNR